jgi:uncharacterized membrane protein
MTFRLQLLTRIALFSGLLFVFSWGTSYFPNVNLVFFIIFSAGFLWGVWPGILVGIIGMGLWTFLNPYGPAALPIAFAQLVGAAFSGLIGATVRVTHWATMRPMTLTLILCLSAIACTVMFYLPVNIVDAWLFQPFWPRFVTSAIWTLISLGSNLLIFPLLFPVTRLLYRRERLT